MCVKNNYFCIPTPSLPLCFWTDMSNQLYFIHNMDQNTTHNYLKNYPCIVRHCRVKNAVTEASSVGCPYRTKLQTAEALPPIQYRRHLQNPELWITKILNEESVRLYTDKRQQLSLLLNNADKFENKIYCFNE